VNIVTHKSKENPVIKCVLLIKLALKFLKLTIKIITNIIKNIKVLENPPRYIDTGNIVTTGKYEAK
jgi:hypothetical protein